MFIFWYVEVKKGEVFYGLGRDMMEEKEKRGREKRKEGRKEGSRRIN
jgi:hypothetical protein